MDPGALENLDLAYASIPGDEQLRQGIADYHNDLNRSQSYGPDQVVTFCGAQEALRAIYAAILHPGDEVIVATPAYPSLTSMVTEYGAFLRPLRLSVDNKWRLDLNELRALLTSRTRLLVLNYPHNPTGAVLSPSDRRTILEMLREYDCYLLLDDVAQGINPHDLDLGHDFLSFPKSVVVSVLSKSFGLGGIRIGWAITSNGTLREQLTAFKTGHSICTSVVDERLAIVALRNRQTILRRNNDLVLQNSLLFEEFAQRHQDHVAWLQPAAGMLTMVSVNCQGTVEDWCMSVARESGVSLLPGSLFGQPGNWIRLGLGQADFSEALAALESYFHGSIN
jgi:aspartate/methionine/tyrosine aminotransferase